MKVGAVAFLDALGFKGITQRWDAEQVLDKVQEAEWKLDMISTPMTDRPRGDEMASWVEERFLVCRDLVNVSDTVIIMAWPLEDHAVSQVWAFRYVFAITGIVTRFFGMFGPPHLPLRGCVAWGQFDKRAQYVVGEAVDTAAEGEKAVNGAIVWLHENARGVFEDALVAALEQTRSQDMPHREMVADGLRATEQLLVRDYMVPFKASGESDRGISTGRSRHRAATVVNPFAEFSRHDSRVIADQILSEFTTADEDVRAKRANTAAFFDALLA